MFKEYEEIFDLFPHIVSEFTDLIEEFSTPSSDATSGPVVS